MRKDTLFVKFLGALPGKTKKNLSKLWEKQSDHFATRAGYLEKISRYGFEVASGVFRLFDERAFSRELSLRGLYYAPGKKPGAHSPPQKDLDKIIKERNKIRLAEILSLIRETRTVDFIGELSGYQPGYYDDINGHRLLITRAANIPPPKKGDYQFYEETTHSMLECPQADVIKTWSKYAEEIREGGPPFGPLQALIIAGGVEHGKTLYAQEILGGLLGGYADATLYFTHDSHGRFNDELARAAVSLLDDQNFPAHFNLQSFLDRLRKHTATTSRRVEAKYSPPINVPLFQATVLLSNIESHSFDWFQLSGDIADKLHLLKASKANLPTGKGHREKIQRLLDTQRSAWRYHLKYEYEPPAGILSEGRYGIKPFHHPDLLKEDFAARQFEDFVSTMNTFTSTECEGQEFIGESFDVGLALANSSNRGIAKWAERNIKSTALLGKWLIKATDTIPNQAFILENPNKRANCHRYRYLSPKKAEAVKKAAETPEAEANIITAKIAREAATGAG
jgi:hypothetical protein